MMATRWWSGIRRARFHTRQNTAAKEVVANLRKDLVARRFLSCLFCPADRKPIFAPDAAIL
jgi:hypothetical protein